MPERTSQSRPRTAEAAERALVKRPQIGDTRPAPADPGAGRSGGGGRGRRGATDKGAASRAPPTRRQSARPATTPPERPARDPPTPRRTRSRRARPGCRRSDRGGQGGGRARRQASGRQGGGGQAAGQGARRGGDRRASRSRRSSAASRSSSTTRPSRSGAGRERKGRPVGRYLMTVSVRPDGHPDRRARGPQPHRALRVAPGRRRRPDPRQHLPGQGAERAARHGGGVRRHRHAEERRALPRRRAVRRRGHRAEGGNARIEQILKPKQNIICQVTKNPIAHKGARLTQEVSLPGRFVVLIPNSIDLRHLQAPAPTTSASACGRSSTRSSRRSTASSCAPRPRASPPRRSSATCAGCSQQWEQIEELAEQGPGARRCSTASPTWPCGSSARSSTTTTAAWSSTTRSSTTRSATTSPAISPALADRVQYYDREVEPLSLFERHHVHEQLHKALDRKVWLPSGGSLIIEHTEALTVIDVNTGKNVGLVEPRGDGLPQQPRGRRRDRQAAAAARHRRHHRHRLHRHGDPREPRRGHQGRSATRWPGTRPAPRCSTSPSWAWSR